MSDPSLARVASGTPAGGQFTSGAKAVADFDDLDLGVAPAGDRPGQTVLLSVMNTMQTRDPIERLTMGTSNRSLYWLIAIVEDGKMDHIDVDQPYQRGFVWGVERKQKLIKSLLEGVPVPSLIVNKRLDSRFREPGYSQERNWATAIIDGKQRVSAIVDFVAGDYALPASWFKADRVETTEDTTDGPYVRWSGLSESGRRMFGNLPIAVSEGQFKTLAEEQEIFDRVNFGGVAQGESDL